MKKILSLILATMVLLSAFSMAVSAIPLSSGTTQLNNQFVSMSESDLDDVCDAVYYSPVKGNGDTAKYPLVIWIHGMHSGKYPRAQLNGYEFSNWASDEFQARFGELGGCFLFAPRARDEWRNDWNPQYTTNLKHAIDYFVATFKNHIDTTRIYIAGYSTGGAMVWDMLVSYPQFFAAAVAAAPISQVTEVFNDATISKVCDIPLWLFCSDNDYYETARTGEVMPVFNKIANLSSIKDRLRITTVSDACFADYRKLSDETAQHYIWEAITYDMHMADGVTPYVNCTTRDGAGNDYNFQDANDGVIRWLAQQQVVEKRDTSNKGESVWDKIGNFFKGIFASIKNLFQNLFNKFK